MISYIQTRAELVNSEYENFDGLQWALDHKSPNVLPEATLIVHPKTWKTLPQHPQIQFVIIYQHLRCNCPSGYERRPSDSQFLWSGKVINIRNRGWHIVGAFASESQKVVMLPETPARQLIIWVGVRDAITWESKEEKSGVAETQLQIVGWMK